METVQIPVDYVAVPRTTYDMLNLANYQYNEQFRVLQRLVEKVHKRYKDQHYCDHIECCEIAEILGFELEDSEDERKESC